MAMYFAWISSRPFISSSVNLIALDFFNDEVKNLRQQALIYEGSRSSNPNKRNYFLTSALELQKGFNGFPISVTNEELLEEISIDTFFDVLSVRFNPKKHNNDIFRVCFNFSSGVTKNLLNGTPTTKRIVETVTKIVNKK